MAFGATLVSLPAMHAKRARVALNLYLVADPSAARQVLDFRPTHSDLPTIIGSAWAWHQKAHPLKLV